ncbi:MAG: NAD+ synthase [Saprospiraceae bacterium]|nr:NAD+ synthase [Saprospiraceae bacterium]
MRIAIAQLNYHIGNFEGNVEKMLQYISLAREQGADIVCFSELATCGYPPRDFLEFDDFIRLAQESIDQLAEAAQDIAVIVGGPSRNPVIEGKDLFNSAFLLFMGKIVFQANKALLPTYDIFDEYRYFEPSKSFNVYEFQGKRIALTVCEDLWNIGNENPLYTICPMDEMRAQSPDLIINISASPFAYDHADDRIHVIRENAVRYNLPLFYINHVGAQTELLFDGGSLVVSPDGKVYDELPYFKEEMRIYALDDVVNGGIVSMQPKEKMGLIHDALVMGVKDYFGKLRFKKAILGLSGGIDSAVTAAIVTRALGSANVRGIIMPSRYSSDHSIEDAQQLASSLNIRADVILIEQAFQAFETTLAGVFQDAPIDVTEENIQARCRAVILMALSNKYGYILLNTSNKSEAAVGYGTLYGDMAGGLSVIGDLYKMEVYGLAEYINAGEEVIPRSSIVKPPSAELRPDQKDSDSLPDYEVLDQILYQYIENELGPREIIQLGFEEELVRNVLRLVNINEFKRFQTPPVLRVSSKAFGMGRRMPIVGKYLS